MALGSRVSVEDDIAERISRDEALDLLCALIERPSAAPECPEADCASALAERLRKSGIEAELSEVEPRRPNVLAQLGGRKGPALLLAAHLDTVGPGNRGQWSSDPFTARLSNGKVFGRGASDDKGGVTAVALAVMALHRAGALPSGRVALAAVMGEETGNVGMRHFVTHAPPFDGALVAEWTGAQEVALGYRGALWVEVETTGLAAHGARPKDGVNAIDLMTERVLPVVKSLSFSYRPDPVFRQPHPTVNVGCIEGGSRVNVVADSCRALVDLRLVPGISCLEAETLIRQALEEVQRGWDKGSVAYRILLKNEPFLIPESTPLVQVLRRTLEDLTGKTPPLIGKTGFSDANVLVGEAGIPTVTYGPGNNTGHGPDEFVELDEVVTAAKAIALTAYRFMQERSQN